MRQWQAGAAGTIRGAKRRGFAAVVQDESIFVWIGIDGREPWSRVGDPVADGRHGRRDRVAMFGALADDGTRLVHRYGRLDGPTFVECLKEVRRKWGKALVIMDNAGQHKTGRSGSVWRGTLRWRCRACRPRCRNRARRRPYGRRQSTYW